MSIARISKDIYKIGLPNFRDNCYLVNLGTYYILIDSTSGEYINDVIRSILEIIVDKNKLSYIILTSCLKNSAGGACEIHRIFGTKIVSHYPDSISIRHGNCNNQTIDSCEVFMELRKNVETIENLYIFNTKTPTLGSIIIRLNNIMFIGNSKISIEDKNIKIVCDNIDCWKI
ncbi:MBL fold metallo-hydrolase [Acidianus brierleyi]|uniref:Hydrolase n=1 Tax=Acidianus brierleyi TaxID=41673 RepID=A0A2U9IEM9_9CREN|nr:MBL fold metallo-hydrolase [Acidianus brierleyi]AWR94491.1 MBL fold metallo-hydrolase [Acidianus brierleyi]